mmetsp:Transcript_57557/g.140573  ORF Transcript_57557/g.140573 Transcript_57557/m.140573 type:complete len:208 (+) Transcript_57557:521-1144(+)
MKVISRPDWVVESILSDDGNNRLMTYRQAARATGRDIPDRSTSYSSSSESFDSTVPLLTASEKTSSIRSRRPALERIETTSCIVMTSGRGPKTSLRPRPRYLAAVLLLSDEHIFVHNSNALSASFVARSAENTALYATVSTTIPVRCISSNNAKAFDDSLALPQALIAAEYATMFGRVEDPPSFILSMSSQASTQRPSAPQQAIADE